MSYLIQVTQTTRFFGNPIDRSIWETSVILVSLALFALSPMAQAVNPPPDGGYPNGNTAEGEDALFSLTSGIWNTAIGWSALYANTTGGSNTACGEEALVSNTTGDKNTALGDAALAENTTGSYNTATGSNALFGNFPGGNSTGSYNTANGASALQSYTTGSSNTANGYATLFYNTSGDNNTATGHSALYNNTVGVNNVAAGVNALKSNTTGNSNTANGVSALLSNTTGQANTAVGISALSSNTTGGSNIALGQSAGINLTTGSNNIDIGNAGVAAEGKTIRIGTTATHTSTYIAGIYGATASHGIGVFVDSTGRLGTTTSSARFKDEIKPMDKASEVILALKPVIFRYKHDLDPGRIPQFGLVAEDVEKVNPDLIARDDQGKPYTVRYEAVNAMLLNEFLKEHTAFLEEKRKVQELQANAARQQNQIEVLTAGLQKVSGQLDMSKLHR